MLNNSGVNRPAPTASGGESPVVGDHDPPIDLVHLARQCQGDPGLEIELLGLFRRHAGAQAKLLSDPDVPLAQKGAIAHKLRGSALTIGAGRVARAAQAIETLAGPSGGGRPREQTEAVSLAIEAAQAAVAEAIARIDRLRG